MTISRFCQYASGAIFPPDVAVDVFCMTHNNCESCALYYDPDYSEDPLGDIAIAKLKLLKEPE